MAQMFDASVEPRYQLPVGLWSPNLYNVRMTRHLCQGNHSPLVTSFLCLLPDTAQSISIKLRGTALFPIDLSVQWAIDSESILYTPFLTNV